MVFYVRDLLVLMLFGTPLYIIFRINYLKWKMKRLNRWDETTKFALPKEEYLRELIMGVFVLFMTGLFLFVSIGDYRNPISMVKYAVERLRTKAGMNLVPFRTIDRYYRHYHFWDDIFLVNVLGNVAMFIPWGFCLPLLWKKNQKIWKAFAFAILLPCCIEFMQLFIGRQVDVDDILLNFLGGICGAILYLVISMLLPKIKNIAK